ncbi:hypothetical protein [Mycolicibacterium tusciae]|uniref:hypothetical protein n=1 Tax=Mycolicibacterium tusciae TaxID=75922 RepID=UPI00024A1F54|nr:hypothetical protein [Mycolicibacterium tusciae]
MFDPDTWGTVGQWVGSLLTGGSLLLGFSILRINQQDKRRAQAALVTFTTTRTRDPDNDFANGVRGSVYNGSDLPISYARVEIRSDKLQLGNAESVPDPTLITIADVFSEDESIAVSPKNAASYNASFSSGVRLQPNDLQIRLTFTDGDGREWRRDSKGQLSEVQKFYRVRRTRKPLPPKRKPLPRKRSGKRS